MIPFPAEPPVVFQALPARLFPFTIRAYPVGSDEWVWSETINAPRALKVPGLRAEHGPIRIVIEYADGTITEDTVWRHGG